MSHELGNFGHAMLKKKYRKPLLFRFIDRLREGLELVLITIALIVLIVSIFVI